MSWTIWTFIGKRTAQLKYIQIDMDISGDWRLAETGAALAANVQALL